MTRDELQNLRENWDFEAKLAGGADGRGALPRSLWETYSAMANTEGGRVLLGARELDDGALEPVGIPDIEKVEGDLWNALGDRAKVSVNLLVRGAVQRIEVDGLTLLQLDIPKASRGERPVFLNGSWQKHTYVRVHDGDRRVTEEIARRMLADAEPSRDLEVPRGFKVDDLDDATIRQYRDIFVSRRPDHPFGRHQGIEFLRSIGAWALDRATDVEGPTRAGLLMFGRSEAIRALCPGWILSYKEVAPDHPRWVDRIVPDGTWEANVFAFYGRVAPKLLAGVKTPFALSGTYRNDETPVHGALREAFVNALVHADYAGLGGVRVVRSASGYEFVNPGLPLVSVDQLWRGGRSVPRNPTLAGLFAHVLLGEREGSGGPAIRSAWTQQHWRPPVLRTDQEHCETRLELRQESLLPPESIEELSAVFGKKFTGLDELGRIAVVLAHAEGKVSHARLRELTDQHSRDLTLKLQDLVHRGLLEPMGKGTGRSYRLCGQDELPLSKLWEEDAGHGGTQPGSPDADGSSPRSAEKSPRSGPRSPRSGPGFPRSEEAAGATDPDPQAKRRELDPVVERVAGSRWAPSEQVRAAVLAACRDGFSSLAEIMAALNRSANTIQGHVRALLEQGALELEYPDKPNHPKQAYRARSTQVEA